MFSLFVTCPKGIEPLLADELSSLDIDVIKPSRSGVYANATLEQIYRCCLWSRLANRVLLILSEFDCESRDALYDGVAGIDWQQHLTLNQSLAIDFWGTNNAIRHTQFGAQVAKDAVVDCLRQGEGRPEIKIIEPDIRLNLHLRRGRCTLSLDVSGHSLHQRGYRYAAGPAPLKENLAAAILIRSGWQAMMKESMPLLDPMCGSATFLIEAAMMAGDIAPGLLVGHWGFQGWKQHDEILWQGIFDEVKTRAIEGKSGIPKIYGFDQHPHAIANSQQNIEALGLQDFIALRCLSLENALEKKYSFHQLVDDVDQPIQGLLVCNPPYGHRLGEKEELQNLYKSLGNFLKSCLPGWQAGLFTPDAGLVDCCSLYSHKQYQLFNGSIECKLFLFYIRSEEERQLAAKPVSKDEYFSSLDEQDRAFLNRLKKNHKHLEKWTIKNNIRCYRLYDADLPDFAAAIDIYDKQVYIQEYQAPKSIGVNKAKRRFSSLKKITRLLLDVPLEFVHIRQRRRQKGSAQYLAVNNYDYNNDHLRNDHRFVVNEGLVKVFVNLDDYLDTGLFLDHRPLRKKIAQEVNGKRFLNLFCYTGVATCHAVLGGATETVSVDLSRTYLNWAADNLRLNGVDDIYKHRFIKQDCLQWLASASETFDLIMLDPPTFSNSKSMEGVLDIQRDHVKLIEACMRLLAEGGVLYFSTNFRKFRIEEALGVAYRLEEITESTLDQDFNRRPYIHKCWKISHK